MCRKYLYLHPLAYNNVQCDFNCDVEALYPSLKDTKVAEIIFNAIMETKVGFEGVNHQEGARYIVLH